LGDPFLFQEEENNEDTESTPPRFMKSHEIS
jgi:hypothetical protein